MRTNKLKELVESSKDEYEEYWEQCMMNDTEPMDIFTWVITEQATEEEYRNDMLRDDALMDVENVS